MEGASRCRALPTVDDAISHPRIAPNARIPPARPCEACEMKLEVHIGTLARQIEIQRTGPNQFAIGGNDSPEMDTHIDTKIDAVEVAPNTYSILVNGRAFEAVVLPAAEGVLVRCGGREFHATVSDPRAWRGGRGALFGAEGKQRVIAPMPGKVIRILV